MYLKSRKILFQILPSTAFIQLVYFLVSIQNSLPCANVGVTMFYVTPVFASVNTSLFPKKLFLENYILCLLYLICHLFLTPFFYYQSLILNTYIYYAYVLTFKVSPLLLPYHLQRKVLLTSFFPFSSNWDTKAFSSSPSLLFHQLQVQIVSMQSRFSSSFE